VQARAPDGDTADGDGVEVRDGREDPRLADLHLDRAHHRRALARRELERDRPARVVGRAAEPLLVAERVDLDHDAVRLVGQPVARAGQVGAVPEHGCGVGHAAVARVDRQPGGA
jgi:hypothetical protein